MSFRSSYGFMTDTLEPSAFGRRYSSRRSRFGSGSSGSSYSSFGYDDDTDDDDMSFGSGLNLYGRKRSSRGSRRSSGSSRRSSGPRSVESIEVEEDNDITQMPSNRFGWDDDYDSDASFGRKRRGSKNAAKAMRMASREGISLKEAWARVKGGRGGSSKRRKRSGSRRRRSGSRRRRSGSRRRRSGSRRRRSGSRRRRSGSRKGSSLKRRVFQIKRERGVSLKRAWQIAKKESGRRGSSGRKRRRRSSGRKRRRRSSGRKRRRRSSGRKRRRRSSGRRRRGRRRRRS